MFSTVRIGAGSRSWSTGGAAGAASGHADHGSGHRSVGSGPVLRQQGTVVPGTRRPVQSADPHLIGLGVGPESRVVLALGRSIDLWVAVWAVTKSGAAFVPLDPHTPDRMTYLLGDSHAVAGYDRIRTPHDTSERCAVDLLDDNDFAHTLRRRSAAPVGRTVGSPFP